MELSTLVLSCFRSRLRRPFAALVLAFLPMSFATAQETGIVTGVVTDPRSALLQGVEVRVEGTSELAVTDRTGRFRLDGVPVGTQRITARFLGLDPVSTSVNVTAGAPVNVDLTFKDETVTLDRFVVESIAEGQARAINQQRASDTIKNIVAADALGRLPDANVAEALRRMPGIAVQNDLGEPEFISVRGTGPKFSAVSLNGDRLPSVGDPTESRDNRAVSLHSVPTDLISGIEVTKAVTPDMDADAVGANVNLLTKTSLEFNRRVFTGKIEAGYNDIRDSTQHSGSLTYGDKLPGGNIGYLFSASTYESERGLDSFTNSYASRTTTDGVVIPNFMTELQYRHRYLTRSRDALSGQVDFRTGADSTHYVRGFVNTFEDAEERRRLRVGFGENSRILPGSNGTIGISDGGRLRREDRIGTKTTDIYNFAAGGKWEKPGYVLDYSAAYTWTAFKVRRNVYSSEYRLTDFTNSNGVRLDQDNVVDLTYDRSDVNRPIIGDPLGHFDNLGRFSFSSRGNFAVRDDDTTEEDLNGAINLKIPGRIGDRQVDWKFGLRYRGKEKDNRPQEFTYAVVGTPALTVATFPSTDPLTIFDGDYRVGPSTEVNAARTFFNENPTRFAINTSSVDNSIGSSYQAEEDIFGAYAMGTTDFGALRLVGGLRYERTENTYRANQRNVSPTGAFLGFTPVTETGTYDNVFPSLVGTYRLRDDLLIRAAITSTIARPDYSLLAPVRTVNDQNDRITDGNTGLKPFESYNFDLSIEKYLPSAGVLSAAVFHKEIKNFTFSNTTTVVGGEFDGFILTRPENGPKASLTGLEFSWSQTFRNLPKPFDGFGIQSNLTLIDGESEVPGRGTVDVVSEQVERVYNVQIFYEKAGFSARVAYFNNGRYLDGFGADAAGDTWFDELDSWDVSLGYKIRRGWNLYLEGRNLENSDKKRIYRGTPDAVIEQEYAGWSVVGGLKFEF